MKDASRDPQMDSSQDYRLLLGYENKTHTVLRFSRRYDTCDPRDLKITVGDAIYSARKAQDNLLRSAHKAREIYLSRLSCTIFCRDKCTRVFLGGRLIRDSLRDGIIQRNLLPRINFILIIIIIIILILIIIIYINLILNFIFIFSLEQYEHFGI